MTDERADQGDVEQGAANAGESPARDAVERARAEIERRRPQVERLVKDATPKVQEAAKQALDYARDHDQEIKGAARALLWARVRGPWRLALGAFESASADRRHRSRVTRRCEHCDSEVALAAKFCNECGGRLGG